MITVQETKSAKYENKIFFCFLSAFLLVMSYVLHLGFGLVFISLDQLTMPTDILNLQ